jgi:hypothetical protein
MSRKGTQNKLICGKAAEVEVRIRDDGIAPVRCVNAPAKPKKEYE